MMLLVVVVVGGGENYIRTVHCYRVLTVVPGML